MRSDWPNGRFFATFLRISHSIPFYLLSSSLYNTSITAKGRAVLAAALGRTELDNLQ